MLEAATGAGALKALQETKTVDLLITDIRLADALTGWDIADAFRASSPVGPVIYASGNPDNVGHRVAGSSLTEQASGHVQAFGCLSQGSARERRQLSAHNLVDRSHAGALSQIPWAPLAREK